MSLAELIAVRTEMIRRRAASSVPYFAKVFLSLEPDPWQSQLWNSRGHVILNLARQSGKSTATAVMALHQALFKEKQTIVVTAKTLRQASFLFKKILIYLRDVRSVKFEVKIVGTEEQTKLTLYLENGSQILCLPGSPDTIRGVSAVDLLLVDEAAMCSDDLFQALTPMLAVSGGRMILLSTPNGKMGFFYEIWSRWLEQGEKSGWTGITLRASENPRISPDFLRLERETKSPIRYRTEYECEFLDTEEQLISTEMIDALKNSDVPILNL